MESTSEKTMSPTSSSTPSPPQSPNSPLPMTTTTVTTPTIIMSPCAACKILRRRCAEKCVLAPYFPPTDPLKFTIAHKVFGASNIIKLLQELPEAQRADAVSSMVYEANARLRDPVYGCAGAICQLQKQVNELQAELAKSRAEMVNLQCQQANLLALICMQDNNNINNNNNNNNYNSNININSSQVTPTSPQNDSFETSTNFLNFYDDNNVNNPMWDPLWT